MLEHINPILNDNDFGQFKSEILAAYDQIKQKSRELSREARDLSADASRIANDESTIQSLNERMKSKQSSAADKARSRFESAISAVNEFEDQFDNSYKVIQDKMVQLRSEYTLSNAQSAFLDTIDSFASDVKSSFESSEEDFELNVSNTAMNQFVDSNVRVESIINAAFEAFYDKMSSAQSAKDLATQELDAEVVSYAAAEASHESKIIAMEADEEAKESAIAVFDSAIKVADKGISRSTKDISNLESDKVDAESHLDSIDSPLRDKRSENDSLEAQLKAATPGTAEYTALEESIAKVESEIGNLEDSLVEAKGELNEISDDLYTAVSALEGFTSDKEQLESSKKDALNELQVIRKSMDESQAGFTNDSAAHSVRKQKFNSDIDHFDQQVSDLQYRVSKRIEEAVQLIEEGISSGQFVQIDGVDVTSIDFIYTYGEENYASEDLRSARSAVNAVKAVLDSAVSQRSDSAENFTSEMNGRISDISGYQAQVTLAESDIKQIDRDIEDLEEEKSEKENELSEIESNIAIIDEAMKSLDSQREALEGDLKQETPGTAEFAAIEAGIAKVANEFTQAQSERDAIEGAKAAAAVSLTQKISTIDEKGVARVQLASDKADAQSEFEKANNDLTTLLDDRKQNVASLEEEVASKSKELSELEVSLTALDPFRAAFPSLYFR